MLRFFRRFISHCLWALLSLIVTMVIVFGAVYTYIELRLPNVEVLKDMHMQVPLRVYTADGKLLAQYGAKRRIPVKLEQIPKQLVRAVLATEDARYYEHPGVDFIGLIRAAKAVIVSGKKVQGASTITMQVARNFFLSRKKTYWRKIKEILLALKIDKDLSKDKVLELYLNKVYFGNRAYGVAAAAKVYYGKTLQQLTLPQMAMIAGLPQAPSRNNPLSRPKAAKNRRDHVLWRMFHVGFIDKATYEKARTAPLTAKYHGLKAQVRAPYVAEMVRQVMVAEFGNKAYEGGYKVYTTISSRLQHDAYISLQDGLLAYSERHGFHKPTQNLGQPSTQVLPQWEKTLKKLGTVDRLHPAAVLSVAQQQIQVLLTNGNTIIIPWSGLSWAKPALRDGYYGKKPKTASQIVKPGDVIWIMQQPNKQWKLVQIPKVQGALVSVNPQDGALLALQGGFDYRLSNFNRATQAERRPGSNFKPFVYSAALAKGYTLATLINDAPIVLKDSGENRLWRPNNDTLKFYGPTRLRVGLTQSRNLVSIRLLQQIGIPYALNYIRRFGLNPKKLPHSLSLALGSGSVTPLQIAVGYSTFANGGYKVTPYFIQTIAGAGGKVLFQAKPPQACEVCITIPQPSSATIPQPEAPQVLTFQNAYLMTQAMRGVIQTGTGHAAKILHRSDLAGKTGTTNNRVDAWFSGFNSNVMTTVWVGFDNMQPVYEYGAQAALPIWIEYMGDALKGMPEHTMPEPAGIVAVRIDPRNGLLANPGQRPAMFEIFRKQYEPNQFSQVGNPTPGAGSPGDMATKTKSEPNATSANPNSGNDAVDQLF